MKQIKQILNLAVLLIGIILIVVGVVAVFAPIIPGFILVIPGVYLVSLKSVWAKKKLERFIEKYPSLGKIFKK